NYFLVASSRYRDGAWGATDLFVGYVGYSPRPLLLHGGAEGTAALVWTVSPPPEQVMGAAFDGTRWIEATPLSPEIYTGLEGPILAGNARGDALTMFGSWSGRGAYVSTDWLSNAMWGSPPAETPPSEAPPPDELPPLRYYGYDAAFDDHGSTLTAWTQSSRPSSPDPDVPYVVERVVARHLVPGVSSRLTTLTEDGGGLAQVALTADGKRGLAVYSGQFRRLDATGTWSEASPFAELEPSELAMDAAGNALAIGTAQDGLRSRVRTRHFDAVSGSWDNSRWLDAAESGELVDPPQLALAANGVGFAVWTQRGEAAVHVWAARFDPTLTSSGEPVGWGAPQLVAPDDTDDAGYPRVAVDSRGHATVVWERYDGTSYSVWSSRFH
ncbi:MAG: hypothetical protein ABW321_32650, partial [Polyangiales bacterium]